MNTFRPPFKPGGGGPPAGGPSKFPRRDGAFNRDRRGDKDPFNVNESIRAREVRVIGPDAKMLGVYPTAQALQMARDLGLDLIEVAPEAKPPTCKIMDYGKWKYENKKKAHANKKKQVIITLKEIQLRPRTDEHDLEVKLRHARRFLLEGDKVKVNMRFQGREMGYQEVGRNTMKRVAQTLLEIGILEAEPKQEGRQLFMIVAPDAAKIKEYKAKYPEKFANKNEAPPEDDNSDDGGDESGED